MTTAMVAQAQPIPIRRDIEARESEERVLGAALVYSGRAVEALGDLEPDDLALPVHRDVLTALRTMIAEHVVPEPALLLAQLRRDGLVRATADRGPAIVLAALVGQACPIDACAWHRRAVLEARLRREARDGLVRVVEAAETSSVEGVLSAVRDVGNKVWATATRVAGVAK